MAKPRALTQPAHEAAGFLVAAAVAVEARQQRAETLSEPRQAIRRPGLECPEIELDPDHRSVPIDVGTAVDARLDYPQPAPRCSSPNHIRSGLRNGRGIAGVHSPALIDWGRRLIESHADARGFALDPSIRPEAKAFRPERHLCLSNAPRCAFGQCGSSASNTSRPLLIPGALGWRDHRGGPMRSRVARSVPPPVGRVRGEAVARVPSYEGGPDLDQADGRRAVLSP